jgi:hypothetical protein
MSQKVSLTKGKMLTMIFTLMIVLGKEIDCKDRGKWLAVIQYTLICDIH